MHSHHDTIGRLAVANIVVAVLVTAIKYAAYVRTDSVALYSDALESIVNVATAVVTLIAVSISRRPADRRHPFGHHKAEYFSAGFEGALILVAAVMILYQAHEAWQSLKMFKAPVEGIVINGAAAMLNAAWAWFMIRRGRAWNSPAIAADGWHLLTDVMTSVGVLAGVALAAATGWAILDPLLAAAVAVYILWVGWRIVMQAAGGLMDEAVAAGILAEIRKAIADNADRAIEVHDLRTRVAGRATFIEFHLVVPGTMTVSAAHAICDRMEAALETVIEGANILIHVEPEGEAKRTGRLIV
ncbi:MAG: cation diffusion facilitator family transporter [Hyphomicrobiaceae bacterium]